MSIVLYEFECWPNKNNHERKMEVIDLMLLRWICCRTLLDRVLNAIIRNFFLERERERMGARITEKI